MPKITYIHPLDQPLGTRRLLGELQSDLTTSDLNEFGFAVAFAKLSPLLKLASEIRAWSRDGKSTMAIFGFSHQGTSSQALEFALAEFGAVYLITEPTITFHPKIYWFKGKSRAIVYIGSNNLTVGGTETNFETCIRLEFELPKEGGEFAEAIRGWSDLLPHNCPACSILTPALLTELTLRGLLLDESVSRTKRIVTPSSPGIAYPATVATKRVLTIKPPTPLPKTSLPVPSAAAITIPPTTLGPAPASTLSFPVRGLAIQIRPHRNGEIFLSKIAVNQNPGFFGWPFTGLSTPKKSGNPPYPQRVPDPVVNIDVFQAGPLPVLSLKDFSLNTVYYKTNGEVRITASRIVSLTPEYSILVMRESQESGIDYDIEVYTPSSPEYLVWLAVCNQKMPGGGRPSRYFGWF